MHGSITRLFLKEAEKKVENIEHYGLMRFMKHKYFEPITISEYEQEKKRKNI